MQNWFFSHRKRVKKVLHRVKFQYFLMTSSLKSGSQGITICYISSSSPTNIISNRKSFISIRGVQAGITEHQSLWERLHLGRKKDETSLESAMTSSGKWSNQTAILMSDLDSWDSVDALLSKSVLTCSDLTTESWETAICKVNVVGGGWCRGQTPILLLLLLTLAGDEQSLSI